MFLIPYNDRNSYIPIYLVWDIYIMNLSIQHLLCLYFDTNNTEENSFFLHDMHKYIMQQLYTPRHRVKRNYVLQAIEKSKTTW
jgi:hypothetical protein